VAAERPCEWTCERVLTSGDAGEEVGPAGGDLLPLRQEARRDRFRLRRLWIGPGVFDWLAVAGMVGTEGEKLQALGSGLEGARRRWRYANRDQRTDVEELVVELDSAASSENDVDLLGLGMSMCEGAALPRSRRKSVTPVRSAPSASRATRASQRSPKPFPGAASSTAAKLTIVNASGNETPPVSRPHHCIGSAGRPLRGSPSRDWSTSRRRPLAAPAQAPGCETIDQRAPARPDQNDGKDDETGHLAGAERSTVRREPLEKARKEDGDRPEDEDDA
jgi:hypothetical protein